MPRLSVRILAASLFAVAAPVANAAVISGPGGQGVPVGQSGLIGQLDYSDTFTGTDAGGQPDRPFVPAVQPTAAYVVENTYGNPAQNFVSQSVDGGATGRAEFSFAADGPGTPGLVNGNPAYPGSSGAGSDTGFTQTGNSVDYGIPYGLRPEYVVQVDAIQSGDRIDISSGPTPGTIFAEDSVSVFFRGDGSGNASLFRTVGGQFRDTPIQSQPGYENFNTGITGSGQWHNYAVRFDQTDQEIEIFVDEVSAGVIDLETFAGGLYANFSNAAVGAGGGLGAGNNRTWTDNFQVGAPVPEPATMAVASLGLLALAARRRR
jgi:hypothetical protein